MGEGSGLLLIIVSKKTFDFNEKPTRTHSFDTGAAWENLALQGSLIGLVVHGMEGFDYEQVRETLNVPDSYEVEAMVAIGQPGKKEKLAGDLKDNEHLKQRKELSGIVAEGEFDSDWRSISESNDN